MKQPGERDNIKGLASAMTLFMRISFCMIVPLTAGFFLGMFIDEKAGTSPLFMIICLLASIVAGFRGLYVIAAKRRDG